MKLKKAKLAFCLFVLLSFGFCLTPQVKAVTYQDLENDWMEVDANNKLTVSGTSVTFENLSRSDTVELTLASAKKTYTFFPMTSDKYPMNITVTNKATQDKAVTVKYWIKNETGTTLWSDTKGFIIKGNATTNILLYYPLSKEGTYTAYAQTIVDNTRSEPVSQKFQATHGFTLNMFHMILIVLALICFIIVSEEVFRRTKKTRQTKKERQHYLQEGGRTF